MEKKLRFFPNWNGFGFCGIAFTESISCIKFEHMSSKKNALCFHLDFPCSAQQSTEEWPLAIYMPLNRMKQHRSNFCTNFANLFFPQHGHYSTINNIGICSYELNYLQTPDLGTT